MDEPKASSLGDFTFPTATEARAVPVVSGTCHSKGPNVVWYGDLRTEAIKVKSGLFSSTTIGYKYYLGMQLVVCHGPIDSFVELRVDGKKPTYTVTNFTGWDRIVINDPTLFGDEKREGGISGTVDLYHGTTTQTPNDYLETKLGQNMPAYPGICYAVFRQCYLGNSNFIKPISFIVRRNPANLGLTTGAENISGDANPAEMIYETLTDPRWGLGMSATCIDAVSFSAAGETLATEAMGLSIQMDSPAEAKNALNEICRHVDATLYQDPSTALLTLALARDDYDPLTLPVFDEDNIDSLELNRMSWGETKNVVKITYVDRSADYSERIAQQQNLGNIHGRGGQTVVESIDCKGFSNATAANRAAARAIKTLSYPLASVHFKTNRSGWALRPGSVFSLVWPDFAIDGIYRVIRINYGSLTEGAIEIDATEDIFAVTGDAFLPPGAPGWTDPAETIAVLAEQELYEHPRHGLTADERYVSVLAGRAGQQEIGCEIWSDTAGGTAYSLTNDADTWTPYAYLAATFARADDVTTASFQIVSGHDIQGLASCTDAEQLAGANLLMIGDEIMAWKTITADGGGGYTISDVWRGVLDTVPEDHAAGDVVWFLTEGMIPVRETAYPADLTLTAKALPRNVGGAIAIGTATQLSITTESRAWLPYPPGNLTVNDNHAPATTTDDAKIEWAHRNRSTQATAEEVYHQERAGTPTIEGTVTLEVLVDGVAKYTDAAVTAAVTSYTYPAATRATDDTDGLKTVVARLTPINGALTGHVNETTPFVMTGLGMTLGAYFGGLES